jgi:hypothetical protein
MKTVLKRQKEGEKEEKEGGEENKLTTKRYHGQVKI